VAKAIGVEWLDAAGAANIAPAKAPFARVLVCDPLDRRLTVLRCAPDAGDLADAKYPGASKRSTFLDRRTLLRAFAARCAGVAPEAIRISYDENGAPRVSGAPLFVSASSRNAYAALAVASSPVGVDLEPFDEAAPVIEDVLGKLEKRALSKISDAQRTLHFLQLWTAKEAYLKAVGRGFKKDPALINIDARGVAFTVEDTGFPAALAAGAFAPREDFIVACAVLPPRDES
jgi:4'-phosphopantetheinyl transferase